MVMMTSEQQERFKYDVVKHYLRYGAVQDGDIKFAPHLFLESDVDGLLYMGKFLPVRDGKVVGTYDVYMQQDVFDHFDFLIRSGRIKLAQKSEQEQKQEKESV